LFLSFPHSHLLSPAGFCRRCRQSAEAAKEDFWGVRTGVTGLGIWRKIHETQIFSSLVLLALWRLISLRETGDEANGQRCAGRGPKGILSGMRTVTGSLHVLK
jgi:hypothetical protein